MAQAPPKMSGSENPASAQPSFFEGPVSPTPAASSQKPTPAPDAPASKAQPPRSQQDVDQSQKDQPNYLGHRQRLRDRFMATGTNGLPDYELLELVLFRAIPRRDTKDLAKQLIKTFGSFAEAVHAPPARLRELEGVGEQVIVEFKLIQATILRCTRSAVIAKPALSSWSQVLEYLHVAQGYEMREQFRVLFFDKKNVLIADEVQGSGTIDHTPVYVREVVKRALELSATALILVHNHPSGDPTPSRADIDMTKHIVDAARPLGISIHDHVIIGRNGHASLKALRLM